MVHEMREKVGDGILGDPADGTTGMEIIEETDKAGINGPSIRLPRI